MIDYTRGSSYHSQNQGVVEWFNRNIQNLF